MSCVGLVTAANVPCQGVVHRKPSTWSHTQDWVRADQEKFRRLQRQDIGTTLCLWQAGNQPYAQCTERINRMYAAKHGYEVQVIASDAVDLEGRAPYWGKLKALQACMQDEDQYVVYLDADAFVMQQHQTLHHLLFSDIDLHVGDHGNEQGMWANVNTGVIILRDTKWSRRFLQQWWEAGAETAFAHNAYYEQTVLQHILQGGLHQTREHVAVYPAHVFNTALDLDLQDSSQHFVMHMMSATAEGRATQCSSVLEQILNTQAAWCRTQENP